MNTNLPVITEVMPVAEIMMQSGFFKDTRDVAQAAVKIIAGQELGIGPVAALRGIDIVEGQTTVRAHLAAAMIRKSEKYDYMINEHTDERCVITYRRKTDNVSLGTSIFTWDMAKKAGLANKKVWQQYPQDMLYNRAMSRGARVHCPDIFLGAVYTEGELDSLDDTTQMPPHPVTDPALLEATVTGQFTDYEEPVTVATPITITSPSEAIEDVIDRDTGVAFEVESYAPAAVEPASAKQRGFVLGLLKQHGITEGYKRKTIEAVYPDGPSVDNLSHDIEEFQAYPRLPDRYFLRYLTLGCDDFGVAKDAVAGFCEATFEREDPRRLTGPQQLQLIDWLAGHKPPEQEPVIPDWSPTINFMAGVVNRPVALVESWFYDRTQEMSPLETEEFAGRMSKEMIIEDLDHFEAGQQTLM